MSLTALLAACFGAGALAALGPWLVAWTALRRARRRYRDAVAWRLEESGGRAPLLASEGSRAVLLGATVPGALAGVGVYVVALIPTAIVPAIGELYVARAWLLVALEATACIAGCVVAIAASRGWGAGTALAPVERAAFEQILADEEDARRQHVRTSRASRGDARRTATLADMRHMTGEEFEDLCAGYFERRGLTVDLTPSSGDGGVDLVLTGDGRCVLVQCKRTRKPVGEPVVRDLFGAVHHAGADAGIVCSAFGFTAAARDWARGKPLELIDGFDIERGLREADARRR